MILYLKGYCGLLKSRKLWFLHDLSTNVLWSNIILLVPSRIGLKKCCCSTFHVFFHKIKFKRSFFQRLFVPHKDTKMMILYDFSWNALWFNIIHLVPSQIGLKKCCCSRFHMFLYDNAKKHRNYFKKRKKVFENTNAKKQIKIQIQFFLYLIFISVDKFNQKLWSFFFLDFFSKSFYSISKILIFFINYIKNFDLIKKLF